MSEPTEAAKTSHFTSLLVSDFQLLCSFILSHPLYFSYFIFFSPHFIKIFSFLSPLFITTSLLLLALLSTLNHPSHAYDIHNLNPSFLLDIYQRLTAAFRTKFDGEDQDSVCFEEFEVYKMVFQPFPPEFMETLGGISGTDSKESSTETNEAFVDKFCSHESPATALSELVTECSEEKSPEIQFPKVSDNDEVIVREDDDCDKKIETDLVKTVKGMSDKDGRQKEERSTRSESKVRDRITIFSKIKKVGGNDDSQSTNLGKLSAQSPEIYGEADLGSFGSMRREKEWRRTLACKLFEERHNAVSGGSGGEGMDMLWETYESEIDKTNSSQSTHNNSNSKKKKEKMKNKKEKKSVREMYRNGVEEEDSVNGCDDEYDYDDGKLCCLQALKFSTGKMRLGMGRPNLMKISKAIKGIGWLHHSTKHAKNKSLN